MSQILGIILIVVILLLIVGFYSLIVTRNLIRILISLEILMKAVTLIIIAAGYVTKQTSLAQALIISMIIIEVVVIAVATSIVVGLFRKNGTLDSLKIKF